jgi:hypothetical protein
MAEEKKEMTEEEMKKKLEAQRQVALKNLKTKLLDVAAAYLVHKSGNYGKEGDSAVEQHKYLPALSKLKGYSPEGEEFDMFTSTLLASRQDGELYSGNFSEVQLMKNCTKVITESINNITISDLAGLMGYKGEVRDDIKELPVGVLAANKEDKEALAFYKQLTGSYQTYLATKTVSDALAERAKAIPKSLESLLKPEATEQ